MDPNLLHTSPPRRGGGGRGINAGAMGEATEEEKRIKNRRREKSLEFIICSAQNNKPGIADVTSCLCLKMQTCDTNVLHNKMTKVIADEEENTQNIVNQFTPVSGGSILTALTY